MNGTDPFDLARFQRAASLCDRACGTPGRAVTGAVLADEASSAGVIFGFPDDLKFHSSMTLFSIAAGGSSPFHSALDQYFGGQPDPQTVDLLRR